MFAYDKNTGKRPKLNDRVELCHTSDKKMDGLFGYFAGFLGNSSYTGLVVLDTVYNENKALAVPVVCLREVKTNLK